MEKKVDPGWNDPPMLNYNASNPPPKSRITNKRVAFPLNTTSTTKSQPMSSSPVPLGSIQSPPVLLPSQILNPVMNNEESPTKNSLDTATKLSNFIKQEQDKQIFLDLWKENKFPSDCKDSIELLCQYLEHEDKENFIYVKEKLLAEYKELCDSWITSIEI